MILRSQHHCGGEPGTKAQYPPPQTSPAARVKTTNPEYKQYSARLNQWNQKIPTPRVCRIQGRFSGFSKQLLLTKHLSPYCQVISSSLISLTYLLGFAALVYTILNTIVIYQS